MPGTFSADGLEVCETCLIGTYQPAYAATACLPCPRDSTTWRRGSWRLEDCGSKFNSSASALRRPSTGASGYKTAFKDRRVSFVSEKRGFRRGGGKSFEDDYCSIDILGTHVIVPVCHQLHQRSNINTSMDVTGRLHPSANVSNTTEAAQKNSKQMELLVLNGFTPTCR